MGHYIKITTFESPHKFWFMDEDDSDKCKELQTSINNKILEDLIQVTPFKSMECLVFHKSSFKRASIKDLRGDMIKVWLLDYGIMIDTMRVFKISKEILDLPSYIKLGSLHNVVPSVSRLHYDNFTFEQVAASSFTTGAIKLSKEHLAQGKKITFQCEKTYKNIYCGEIFLHKDEKKYSLNNLLVTTNNCVLNEETFEKMLDAVVAEFPNEFCKRILENVIGDDDELVEGIGRATSRLNFNKELKQDPKEQKEDMTNGSESSNCQILDSDNSNSIKSEDESSTSGNGKCTSSKGQKLTEINFKPAGANYSLNTKRANSINTKNSKESSQCKKFEFTSGDEKNCANKKNPVFKFGCQCESCLMWNTTDLKGHVLEFESKKRPKPIVKAKLLFKNTSDTSESTTNISSITESHRHLTPTILAHGYVVPTPIQSVAKVPFNQKTERILQLLNYKKPKPIQVYSWPTIMRRMNVFVANGGRTGKTMVYVLPLISFITDKHERYSNLPPENGPIIIIMCSNCTTADGVYALLTDIFHKADKEIKVCIAIQPLEKHTMKQFQVPCDILVTTPISLLNLLQNFTINLKRLCHLIIEQIDVMLDKSSKEVYTFLNMVDNMLEHRNCGYPVQLIFTSESWTIKIETLFKKLYSLPLICIGQPLEAAIYGKPDIQMHIISSDKKKIILGDILRPKEYYYKTLIICTNENEIREVERYLIAEGKSITILNQNMPIEKVKEHEIIWKKSKNNLLYICTDLFLKCNFNITDVGCLIHYNLPKDSWTSFCRRFTTLIDNYASPFNSKENDIKCKVHVFVDESCEMQFPKLQNFLQKFSAKLPESFRERCLSIYNNNESVKIVKGIDLCEKMLTFGICDSFNCPQRHNLNVKLESSKLPNSGTIYFRVTNIIDAATFGINILEHIDLDTNKSTRLHNHCKSIEDELVVKCMKCKSYPSKIKLSKWYVWEQKVNEFKRVEVVAILEEHGMTKQPYKVKVELIDYGGTENVSASQLYELPEKFTTIPKQAIIVRLANFVPLENDTTWSKTINYRIKSLFEKNLYNDEDSYFSSRISLTLGNNIWVKDMHLKEVLHVTDVIVTKFSLKNIFIKRNYGARTDEPLEKLYALCEKFNFALPVYQVKVIPKAIVQAEPNWAFFEDKQCNEVYFTSGFSSEKFYVRLTKFEHVFKNYEKEIQREIRKPLYNDEFEIVVGRYYLARDTETPDYCRVQVLNINDDMVECFYVDYGDIALISKAYIKYLTDDQILKLPFQAIECSLYGTKAVTEDSQNDILDILYDYAFEPNSHYFRTLYAKKMVTSKTTKHFNYSIILCDNFNDRPININKIIIDSGLVTCSDDTLLHLEINLADDEKVTDHNEDNVDDDDDGYYNDDNWDIQNPEKFLSFLEQYGVVEAKAIENTEKVSEPNSSTTLDIIGHQDVQEVPYYSPNVLWYQTDTHIKMEILLADVDDYTINLRNGNVFHFKTIQNSKEYQLNLTLFDKVEKTFQHVVFGQYVRVTMKKITKDVQWPRLLETDKKYRNITYDIEKDIKAPPKPKPFLTIDVEESDDENELLYEIGSDEDYNESDISSNFEED